jgi:hypothetical protein
MLESSLVSALGAAEQERIIGRPWRGEFGTHFIGYRSRVGDGADAAAHAPRGLPGSETAFSMCRRR